MAEEVQKVSEQEAALQARCNALEMQVAKLNRQLYESLCVIDKLKTTFGDHVSNQPGLDTQYKAECMEVIEEADTYFDAIYPGKASEPPKISDAMKKAIGWRE